MLKLYRCKQGYDVMFTQWGRLSNLLKNFQDHPSMLSVINLSTHWKRTHLLSLTVTEMLLGMFRKLNSPLPSNKQHTETSIVIISHKWRQFYAVRLFTKAVSIDLAFPKAQLAAETCMQVLYWTAVALLILSYVSHKS